MGDRRSEKGWAKFPNEVLDALVRTKIPGRQRQILDFIIRKTWGYGKESDRISISQMSKATGISMRHVWGELRKLIEKKMVMKIDTENGVTKRPKYMVNKNFEEWGSDTVSGYSPNLGQCGTENGVKNDTVNSVHKRHKDNKTKNTSGGTTKVVSLHRQFVDHWCQTYRQCFNTKYIMMGKKDGQQVTEVLEAIGLQKAKELTTWWLNNQTPKPNMGFTISTFRYFLNAIQQEMANEESPLTGVRIYD